MCLHAHCVIEKCLSSCPINKCPGIQTKNIGDILCRIILKTRTFFLMQDITEVAQYLQLCVTQEVVSVAAVHAISGLICYVENYVILLMDAIMLLIIFIIKLHIPN